MPKTLTAGELIEALRKLDSNRPVLVANLEGDYLNVSEINADSESYAATIEVTDDFSTTQF